VKETVFSLISDERLMPVAERVINGERLSFEDGVTLFSSDDLNVIGLLASLVSRRLNGNFAYFNVNVHITPTNVCRGTCKFCAFRKERGEEGAFELTIDEIVERIGMYAGRGITEVHIVGGLHPDWEYRHYIDMVREVKSAFPDIHVKAFTAEEIKHISEVGGRSIETTLEDLIDAGLGSLPGGGGEIFRESVRGRLCPDKVTAEEYLNIHKTAHRMGLRSNATMLFGHVETIEDRVDHLIRLREAQDETGGFQAFIPLAFHPENTKIEGASYTTGVDELKTIAVSRLLLDNFPHVKAYWIMLGEKVAQISLRFGADDIDGTVLEEEITQAAGARSGQYMPKARLIRLIKEAGKVPVERDTLYNVIKVYG